MLNDELAGRLILKLLLPAVEWFVLFGIVLCSMILCNCTMLAGGVG